jgi:hypothetical protein
LTSLKTPVAYLLRYGLPQRGGDAIEKSGSRE